jgi:dihydrofolate synthase / folylpolyglutamate synthase
VSGPWTLDDAERHLLSLELFGMRFGLDRIRRLTTALGSPQERFGSVHVVGTNGKSSTARMTAAILEAHGLRTGTYLSPHLTSFAERVRVGDRDAEPERFAAAVQRAAHAAAKVDRGLAEDDHVTQFELLTAAAFDHFARAGVDVAVVEAGLGGRYDATNVLDARVVVLTNVAREHTEVLGDTRDAIAAEKLAVVTPDAVVILGDPEWDEVARANGASRVELPGASNLALAVAAAEAHLGRPVDPHAADGLAIPGRLERRGERPLEIWDGAHNLAGIGYLLPRLPAREDWVVLASILEDKRPELMLEALSVLGPQLVATQSSNARAVPAGELARRAEPYFRHVDAVADPREARAQALALAGPEGAVVVTGSLYLLAELSGAGDPS